LTCTHTCMYRILFDVDTHARTHTYVHMYAHNTKLRCNLDTHTLTRAQAAMNSCTLKAHTHYVNGVVIFNNSQHMASCSHDGTIIISDAHTLQVTHTIRGHNAPVECVDVSKDGTRLASGDNEGNIKVHELKDGAAPTELFTLKGHTCWVMAVKFSPDDQKIASCSLDGTVLLLSAQSGEQLLTFQGHGGPVYCLAWSRDSKLVACAGQGNIIRVLDAATGMQVQELKGGHTGDSVCCLVFGATSDVLYSGGSGGGDDDGNDDDGDDDDYAIIEWKLAEGREATVTCRLRGHTWDVNSITTSPCGRMMASGSADKTVVIWELTRKSKIRVLEGHTKWVRSVAWSGDGEFIASGSSDETVRVHKVDVQVRGVSGVIFSSFLSCLSPMT
jgi:WD40 repeat protein